MGYSTVLLTCYATSVVYLGYDVAQDPHRHRPPDSVAVSHHLQHPESSDFVISLGELIWSAPAQLQEAVSFVHDGVIESERKEELLETNRDVLTSSHIVLCSRVQGFDGIEFDSSHWLKDELVAVLKPTNGQFIDCLGGNP